MKKTGGLIAGALVIGGVVLAMRGCLSKADPDVRLAGRFDKMCSIAKDNIKSPNKGVRKLGAYLGDHLGDVTGELGETIAMIEKVKDDDKHDDRARVARDRILGSIGDCAETWMEFWTAVDEDEDATETMRVAGERLNRTLEILFGGDSLAKIRDLPAIEHELEQRLR